MTVTRMAALRRQNPTTMTGMATPRGSIPVTAGIFEAWAVERGWGGKPLGEAGEPRTEIIYGMVLGA